MSVRYAFRFSRQHVNDSLIRQIGNSDEASRLPKHVAVFILCYINLLKTVA